MLKLIGIYLRFGFLGFGGPFALIAMMEEEFVEKRKWIESQRFHQALSIIKVFPGATATQLSIYLARDRLGTLAGLLCGIAFILPSALLVLLLSIFYERVHGARELGTLFQGMQVGALIVIADSVIRMARPYWRSVRAGVIALISGAVIFWRPSLEPFLILGFGFAGVSGVSRKFSAAAFALPTMAVASGNIFNLITVCLKAGFLVFGTGLAIIPVLEADVVGKYHWLTHAEFLDGLAIGQITPGPVTTTATFIGYKVAGIEGATLATIAIFMSAFVNMLIILPIIEGRLKGSPKVRMFSDWAFPAVIGGIVATSLRLTISTVNTTYLFVSLLVLTVALFKLRPPAWAFIPLSGVAIYAVAKLV